LIKKEGKQMSEVDDWQAKDATPDVFSADIKGVWDE
jgi:hypothetical protein